MEANDIISDGVWTEDWTHLGEGANERIWKLYGDVLEAYGQCEDIILTGTK
jgi:hypothetical protein